MARIDLGRLNEAQRPKAPRVARRISIPPSLHVLVVGLGFVALYAPYLEPYGPLIGGILLVVGAYSIGTTTAAGARSLTEAARADRLSDVISLALIGRNNGAAASEPRPTAPEARKPTRIATGARRRAGRSDGQQPLRVVPGTDALDRPLPGEGVDTEGAFG